MLFLFIYTYWCPTRFPHQMISVSSNSHTTGVTCGPGSANPSGTPEFTLVFSAVHPARSLIFFAMFCRSLSCPLVLFLLAIVFSVLRLTASEYPFVIFWIPLWYLLNPFYFLLNTSLVSSEYPFVFFWIPLCYLLNTPLLSSEYPFVIFWISLWYLLNTPLVSSDYPFVIFWIPICYLLNTPLLSSEYLFVIFWIPFVIF